MTNIILNQNDKGRNNNDCFPHFKSGNSSNNNQNNEISDNDKEKVKRVLIKEILQNKKRKMLNMQ